MSDRTAPTVASPPRGKPLLVYDGDCGFCRFWLARWYRQLSPRLAIAPYHEVVDRFPELPVARFRSAAQLIDTDGRVFAGAEAMCRALALVPGRGGWLFVYQSVPGARFLFDAGYRFVAGNRPALFKVTRMTYGKKELERPLRGGLPKGPLLPVAGAAAGAALLLWWGLRRKKRARGLSADRRRARALKRDWKRSASDLD
jgi:predicted DCC family thiol-disulfide oxidoreductase YuxK